MIFEPLTYTVPLSISAHAIAQNCTTLLGYHRRHQYLNILAVLSAQYFLRSLGIGTEVDDLDSPLAAMIPITHVHLPGLGSLHCQAILPTDTHLSIPEEVERNHIGYLAIQFRDDLRESRILGFTETPEASTPLDELADVEALLNHLSVLESTHQSVPQTRPPIISEPYTNRPIVNLRDWLTGQITAGWSDLHQLLNPPQPRLAFRGDRHSITRGQLIDMGLDLGNHMLILAIAIEEESRQPLEIKVQLQPAEATYLPPNLQLQIQNCATGDIIATTTAREADNLVQLTLEADPGDRFRSIILYKNETISQDFLI